MTASREVFPVPTEVDAERADMARVVGGESVCSTLLATVRRQPSDIALRTRAEAAGRGSGWVEASWAEYADRAARVAAGLACLGVRPGDRVAMLLRNQPEFHYTDMGALLARATPVSLYNSSPSGQIRYFLGHCAAPVVVCADDELAARVLAVRDELPDLRHVVVVAPGALEGVRAFDELLAADPMDLDAAAAAIEPDDLATVIYTSGTTGVPKGVMLTHRTVTFNVESFARACPSDLRAMPSISYLPMAHIAERLVTHYLHVRYGTVVTTCAALADIGRHLLDVRPTFWFCAPRMWEKLHTALEAVLATDADLDRRFRAAQQVGGRYRAAVNGGRAAPTELAIEWQRARTGAIDPVLATVGLDRVAAAMTGSAPMPRLTFDFFIRCGIPLSDCYGQSESGGFIAWDPVDVVAGTSGKRFPGTELRIAADGEICSRGPNVFAGYLNAPDLTAQAVDPDGWLHTGDLGRLDAGGNLHIIGRKKEMIVPASGHNVSPIAIEAALKEHRLIGQACVVGDGRPHIVALLVLDADGLRGWAAEHGLPDHDLAAHPGPRAAIDEHVAGINTRFPRPEQVRAYHVLHEEWLPDTDVMTPTAKLKRVGINTRYADVIESLYTADNR